MKKKMVSVLLAAAMGTTALVGFGTTAYADDDVLEFYHGYYQDESEWAAAQVMRDIYDPTEQLISLSLQRLLALMV